MFSKQDRWEAPDRNFIGHRDIMTRSLARYHFVAPCVRGLALDIGCGRGYGFEITQPITSVQAGLDVSLDFLRDARAEYPSVAFVQASGEKLPFCPDTFDTIIAFEVIEHIEDSLRFLQELKRVARKEAYVAISTPNKLFTSGQAERPLNPFHVCEYTSSEFHALLSQVFSSVSLSGQYEWARNTTSTKGLANRVIDLIPVRWKYLLPARIQYLSSVVLRAPLRLEECRFETNNLDSAHTFVALCRP